MTTTGETDTRVQLEVWADIVCPWCYVGRRNLAVALADIDERERPDVTWRAFLLDPNVPEEGVDSETYYAERFGDRLPQIKEGQERLVMLGEELGIEFRFDRQRVRPNSLRAHRVIAAAKRHGVVEPVMDEIYAAHFERGVDIGDPARLRDVVLAAVGDAELAAHISDDAETDVELADQVADDITTAQELGISGVPCFVADRAMAVPGAVPPDGLAKFLAEAASRREVDEE
jgi:predicted DsbA family dithiol-disulfide isomerase